MHTRSCQTTLALVAALFAAVVLMKGRASVVQRGLVMAAFFWLAVATASCSVATEEKNGSPANSPKTLEEGQARLEKMLGRYDGQEQQE